MGFDRKGTPDSDHYPQDLRPAVRGHEATTINKQTNKAKSNIRGPIQQLSVSKVNFQTGSKIMCLLTFFLSFLNMVNLSDNTPGARATPAAQTPATRHIELNVLMHSNSSVLVPMLPLYVVGLDFVIYT